MKKYQKKNGFTLMEAVVYLAIVGILLTAVVSFNLTLGNTAVRLGASVDTARNRRAALNAIDYLIKNSDGLLRDTNDYCSSFGGSPEILSLYFENDDNLPGTCVENGGGVRLTLDDRRVVMYCYPNMKGNGYYNNCDSSVFATGSVYYLTSDDVEILDSNLSFATSTATSTGNPYINITTTLSVTSQNNRQTVLSATSTASSTVVAYAEKLSGLVAWYKFDDADPTLATDSTNGFDLACDDNGVPSAVSGLMTGSSGAFDFESTESDSCQIASPDILAFGNQFSITAWITSESQPSENRIIDNGSWSNQKGYQLYTSTDGRLYCRVFDGTNYAYARTDASTIANDGTVYFVSCIYDKPNEKFNVYVFEDGNQGVATGTQPATIYNLVNNNGYMYVSLNPNYDGKIDDLRFYNRALTDEERWALQSQGDY